jgi:hypothetical protein
MSIRFESLMVLYICTVVTWVMAQCDEQDSSSVNTLRFYSGGA